jgi:hypothetical protein
MIPKPSEDSVTNPKSNWHLKPNGESDFYSTIPEAVLKRSILFNIKEGLNFNRRHTFSISRIKIST